MWLLNVTDVLTHPYRESKHNYDPFISHNMSVIGKNPPSNSSFFFKKKKKIVLNVIKWWKSSFLAKRHP